LELSTDTIRQALACHCKAARVNCDGVHLVCSAIGGERQNGAAAVALTQLAELGRFPLRGAKIAGAAAVAGAGMLLAAF
jgi:hypothetical protein